MIAALLLVAIPQQLWSSIPMLCTYLVDDQLTTGQLHRIRTHAESGLAQGFLLDSHVTQLNIRVVLANASHHLSPQLADLKHIGLVYTA